MLLMLSDALGGELKVIDEEMREVMPKRLAVILYFPRIQSPRTASLQLISREWICARNGIV